MGLSPAEGALCSRAQLVLATGAFSYITPATLSKVGAHCAPVFLFFPLVATDVEHVLAFFKEQGLEVYYDPSQYWLPQRKFADVEEAAVIQEAQDSVLRSCYARKEDCFADGVATGAEIPEPNGAKAGYVHATPLIAGPPGLDLERLVPQWCGEWLACSFK